MIKMVGEKNMRKWTKSQAVTWLKEHNFKHDNYDKMANYHSFRQQDPGQYRKFRVDKSPFSFKRQDGVIIIYGIKQKDGKSVSEMQSIRFYHGETDEENQENQGQNIAKNNHENQECCEEYQFGDFNFTVHRAETSLVRMETLEGRLHLVAPVVAIRAGVLNGERVPAEEIGRYVDAWNGIPLPIGHPRERGVPISANRPDLIETKSVGRFFNAQFEDGTLHGEIWVDVEKARQLSMASQVVLERLEHGDPLEVSTAYFRDIEDGHGVWEGQRYGGTARNLRPDHLALLPYQIGACSWGDGCGAPRVNEEKEKTEGGEAVKNWITQQFRNVAKLLGLSSNEMSHRAIGDALEFAMVQATGDAMSFFIQEVYDEHFIYRSRNGKYFKRAYSIDEQQNVELGDSIQVEREWKEVEQQEQSTNEGGKDVNDKEKGAEKMGNTQKGENVNSSVNTWNRCQVIESFIANSEYPFDESDRSWLSQASDEKIKSLEGLMLIANQQESQEAKEQQEQQESQQNQEQTEGTGRVGETGAGIEELLEFVKNSFDDDFRDFILNERKKQQDHRNRLIGDLVKNKLCQFTEDDLKQMKTNQLEKLAASFMPADYSGVGAPQVHQQQHDDDDSVPSPPAVLLRKKEEKKQS